MLLLDCGAIDDIFNHHKAHPDAATAAADAVFHGTDLDCGQSAYLALVKAVKKMESLRKTIGCLCEAFVYDTFSFGFIRSRRTGGLCPYSHICIGM